jgi:hypothetical protein
MEIADYFAELYVAGRFADAGWNVYFPHRDRGFDFIVSRPSAEGQQLLRPVQVKGKYPTSEKGDKSVYGYVGKLTELHPEMVLAIPFFSSASPRIPTCVAYLPLSLVRKHSRGYRCQPAIFRDGTPSPRRDYFKFYDDVGLKLVEQQEWRSLKVANDL